MIRAVVLAICLSCMGFAQAPRIFIEPDSQSGFDSYVSAAIIKKHVPAVVTRNAEDAAYILSSRVIAKEASATTKVLGCLLAYCAGAAGTQTATVQLIDVRTHEVVWAYNVQKASAAAWQSTSEAVAKHLKEFLEKNPR